MARKGLLVRVGIDQAYGGYNAPINPENNDYLYIPIPQDSGGFIEGGRTRYDDVKPHFNRWTKHNGVSIEFPHWLHEKSTHLDPDFDYCTYGDQETGRGLRVGELSEGDFIAFFASFRPISECKHNLVYALFGFMTVDRVLRAGDVRDEDRLKNAHTRVSDLNKEHLVVYGKPDFTGRFEKAIPIGEYRSGAYRVTDEILNAWGGIDVKDGFIQRSVCPPWFSDPNKFLRWFELQKVDLISKNWGG